MYSEAKENPMEFGVRAGSEDGEQSNARRTKTAPESCFENSLKFRENEKLQALRN